MTLQDWVDFWFRDDFRYKVSFSMSKSSESNKIAYPSGLINKSCICSSNFIHLLRKLKVLFHIQDEVSLVAFLSCWLCKFIFPSKDAGFIHPSTFKVTSMMTTERQYLTIPVLASISKSLKKIQYVLGVIARDIPFCIYFLSSWLT
jgi:hypothetical protein